MNTMIVLKCDTFFQARVFAGPGANEADKEMYFASSRQIITLSIIQIVFLVIAGFTILKISKVLSEMMVKSIVAEINIERLSDLYDLNLITESTGRQVILAPANPRLVQQRAETANQEIQKFEKTFKNLSIPDYLFQSSNTFFRKASSKERIVNLQMTINSKKRLEQTKDGQETQRNKPRASIAIDEEQGGEKSSKIQIGMFPKKRVKELENIQEESLEDDLEKRAQKFHVESKQHYKNSRKANPQLFRSFQQPKEKSEKIKINPLPQEDDLKVPDKKSIKKPEIHKLSFQETLGQIGKQAQDNSEELKQVESPEKSSNFGFEGSSIVNPNDLKYISLQAINTESKICTVCFDKQSDSVYMPCGHGGLCFNCAIEI